MKRCVPDSTRDIPNGISGTPDDKRYTPDDIGGVPNITARPLDAKKNAPDGVTNVPNVKKHVPNVVRDAPDDDRCMKINDLCENTFKMAKMAGFAGILEKPTISVCGLKPVRAGIVVDSQP